MPFVWCSKLLIKFFNSLAVLVPDELGKSRFWILDEGMSDKTLVSLHLVVGELADLIMGLNVVLKQSFLLKVTPHPHYTQGGMGTTKPAVHTVGKSLPGVVPQGILTRVIPNKGKAF